MALIRDLDLEAGVMNIICDALCSGGLNLCQVLQNYLEHIGSCGWDKQIASITFDLDFFLKS